MKAFKARRIFKGSEYPRKRETISHSSQKCKLIVSRATLINMTDDILAFIQTCWEEASGGNHA